MDFLRKVWTTIFGHCIGESLLPMNRCSLDLTAPTAFYNDGAVALVK